MKTASDYMRLDYLVVCFLEGDVYFAHHPELPGCMAHGETDEEAIDNLHDARELYLSDLIERGIEPPEPSTLKKIRINPSDNIGREYLTAWTVNRSEKEVMAEFKAHA